MFVMPWQRPCCPVQAPASAPCLRTLLPGRPTIQSEDCFTGDERAIRQPRVELAKPPFSGRRLNHFCSTTITWAVRISAAPSRGCPRAAGLAKEALARGRSRRANARSNQPPSFQKERGQRRTLAEKPSVAFPEAAQVGRRLAPLPLLLLNLRRPHCRRRSLSRADGPHIEWGSVHSAGLTRLLAGNALWPRRGQVRDRAVLADPRILRFSVAPLVPRRELSPRGVR